MTENDQIPRRAVITGLGALTPVGHGKEALWRAFAEGRSGVAAIESFDASDLPVRIAGEVRGVDLYRRIPPKDRRHVSRCGALAIEGARMAAEDAGLRPGSLSLDERRRVGVLLGSGGGALAFTERQYALYFNGELRKTSVYATPVSTIGTLSSEVSIALGLCGPSHVISTGCTSSTDALFYARQWIQTGIADIVITGGVDAPLAPGILQGFCMMGALTESWNDRPACASRPFSEDRDGFVLGEGAWLYVVESETFARRRGARIYAEIAGYGSTCEAYHRVRLDESGVEPARAMSLALGDAGIQPGDLDYVNLHGTSTVMNDRIETCALKRALGCAARRVPMSASKSMFGHPQGASGAAGVSAVLFAMDTGLIPPTLNLTHPAPECDLDYTPLEPRRCDVAHALANCIGFGSKNSALVLKRVDA